MTKNSSLNDPIRGQKRSTFRRKLSREAPCWCKNASTASYHFNFLVDVKCSSEMQWCAIQAGGLPCGHVYLIGLAFRWCFVWSMWLFYIHMEHRWLRLFVYAAVAQFLHLALRRSSRCSSDFVIFKEGTLLYYCHGFGYCRWSVTFHHWQRSTR